MFLDSWRYQLSPTGSTSSNPTQDGEQAHSSIWGGPSGQELASLCGGWRREAAEATLPVSFPFRREQSSSSQGKPFGFWQCGVCPMTGMEDYCRMGVLSGCDSEHKIKDGRKSKRSLGPVPCLSKPSKADGCHSTFKDFQGNFPQRPGSACFPLTIKKFFLVFKWRHFQYSTSLVLSGDEEEYSVW